VEVEDFAARLDHAAVFGEAEGLHNQGVFTISGNAVADDATGGRELLDYFGVFTAHEDGNTGAVLGDVAGKNACLGVYDDAVYAQVLTCPDSCGSETFRWSD